jgi:hypothetical protein
VTPRTCPAPPFAARLGAALFAVTLLAGEAPAGAQPASLAPAPPMGWNSWDAYGTAVREDQVKANADAMAARLARYGWRYVVVDIQWYQPTAEGHDYRPGARLAMDRYGRLVPAENKFPSAANGAGFKPLADYVHARGLKFGIHIMRGIPRQAVQANLPIEGTPYHAGDVADTTNGCRWNPDMWGVDVTRPGGQAYYDGIARLYASWGVDFVKADDLGDHKFQPSEIAALRRALDRAGRPIVLSISPGPAPPDQAGFLARHAQMWRISDDFWDDWKLVRRQFDYARRWAPYVGIGHTWPDADMLPFGRLRLTDPAGAGTSTRLTTAEQRTVMTLWSILRSPLILGGDVPTLDSMTLALLTNPEVLDVDQRGNSPRQVLERPGLRVWRSNAAGGSDQYVAVFNLGDAARTVDVPWPDIGMTAGSRPVRDLWAARAQGSFSSLRVHLGPHASALFRIGPVGAP